MSHFEFLMVLAGLVVAIAMTEIVSGWGRLLRTNIPVRWDWLHFGWGLCLLMMSLLYWVGMWPYSQIEFTYMGQVSFLVLPTLFLVAAAYTLTPEVPRHGEIDLRNHYLAKQRQFLISLAAGLAAAVLADYVIAGVSLAETDLSFLGLVGLWLIIAYTNKVWVHALVMITTLSILLWLNFISLELLMGQFQ